MSRIRRLAGVVPDYDAYDASVHDIPDNQIYGGAALSVPYSKRILRTSATRVFEAPEDCFVFPLGYSDAAYPIMVYVGDSATSEYMYRVSTVDVSDGQQAHSTNIFLRKGQICSIGCSSSTTFNDSFWLPVKK